jgi:membrane protein DedA with SNARE-associated domain
MSAGSAFRCGTSRDCRQLAKGHATLARCEQLFARRGNSTVFIARLLPLARSIVSLPAGYCGVAL